MLRFLLMKSLLLVPAVTAAFLFSLSSPAEAGSISTSSNNRVTVVVWNGKEVFRDVVDGKVQSKTKSLNGKDMAAVVSMPDGKVLWESEPGAAAVIGAAKKPVQPKGKPQIEVKTKDGVSTVRFKGKEVWKGKTTEPVSAMSKTVDGKTFGAAFEGEKVLWENVKGAAKEVRTGQKPLLLPGKKPIIT